MTRPDPERGEAGGSQRPEADRRPERGATDLFLRACSLLVPSYRRQDWLEEWRGEADALRALRGSGASRDYPTTASFVAGALPHALWIRKEGWTVDSIARDVRYGLRLLRRGPGFSLVAILSLALGIGANGAIVSLVNGLLFRAPPGVAEPERLVQIARSYDEAPRWDNWSWPAVKLMAQEAGLLSGVAGYAGSPFLLGRGEEIEPVAGEYVSGRYFDLLGVRPAVGRLLGPADEEAPGAHPVAVLSHGLWIRRFGGDPGVVGSVLHVGGAPYEVVGVAPEGFVGVEALGSPPELWVPILQRAFPGDRSPFDSWGTSWINAFGRLGEGVGYPAAEAAMGGVTLRLRAASDFNTDIRVLIAPGVGLSPEERTEARTMSLLLGGIALMVLLLTCANVGNLFLARAATRETEMGVRQALGAGRARMARQLLTESLVVAQAAAAVAVPLVRSVGEMETVPGVVGAALASQAPVLGGHARSTVTAADRPHDPAASFEAEYTVVTPGYFETLGIPLLRGRTFRQPPEEPERVVVVNEALARRYWPGEEAVGKELQAGDERMRVVGDVQMRSLRARPNPGVYHPFHQVPEGYLAVHLRVAGGPSAAIPALRRAMSAVDPEVPVTGVTELREGLARSLSETRLFGTVVAVFAVLAMVLSLLGLYGLVSYGVAQPSRELGIRLALGAGGPTLVRMVLARAVRLAALGLVLGIGASLGVGRGLEGVLFGVEPTNPWALGTASTVLFLSAMLAAWAPARRASRVDAAVSLRS
jgi:hypothetical protein